MKTAASLLALTLLAGCCCTSSSSGGADTASNIDVTHRFFTDVINGKNIAVVDELCAPTFIDHEAPPGVPTTVAGTKQFLGDWVRAFPDTKAVVDDVFASGDRVCVRSTWTGTFKADFMGMKSNGKAFKIQVFDILRFENGKVVEHWGLTDSATMMEQLK